MHPNENLNDVYLSTNLKHLRTLAGRSQAEMAAALDIKRSSYSGYEVGSAEPNASVLCRMALRHQVTLDMLLMMDLRKWTRYSLECEQRKMGLLQPSAPTSDRQDRTPPVPATPVTMLNKRLIQERSPRAMNARLDAERTPQRRDRRAPKKVIAEPSKKTVKLRIDARTVVNVLPGYALEKWMERYPNAVLEQ